MQKEMEWKDEYASKLKRLEEEFAKKKEEVKVKPLSQTSTQQHNGKSKPEDVTLCDNAEKQGDEEEEEEEEEDANAADAGDDAKTDGPTDASDQAAASEKAEPVDDEVMGSTSEAEGDSKSQGQEASQQGTTEHEEEEEEKESATPKYASQEDSNNASAEAPPDTTDPAKVTKM